MGDRLTQPFTFAPVIKHLAATRRWLRCGVTIFVIRVNACEARCNVIAVNAVVSCFPHRVLPAV